MSQEHAWPAMRWSREVPARTERPAEAEGGVQALSQVPQAFDLFVFGALSLTVFPQVFLSALGLSALGPGVGVAGAMAVWALAYLVAWPVRAALIRLDGRWDPRIRRALARLLFAGSSLAVAALPDASHTAWALLLLILARTAQGLALGGLAQGQVVHSSTSVEARRQRLRSWICAGSVGFMAGALVLGILAVMLQRADMNAWGWRYPFVMALALNMVAGFADCRLEWARRDRPAERRRSLRLVAIGGARLD